MDPRITDPDIRRLRYLSDSVRGDLEASERKQRDRVTVPSSTSGDYFANNNKFKDAIDKFDDPMERGYGYVYAWFGDPRGLTDHRFSGKRKSLIKNGNFRVWPFSHGDYVYQAKSIIEDAIEDLLGPRQANWLLYLERPFIIQREDGTADFEMYEHGRYRNFVMYEHGSSVPLKDRDIIEAGKLYDAYFVPWHDAQAFKLDAASGVAGLSNKQNDPLNDDVRRHINTFQRRRRSRARSAQQSRPRRRRTRRNKRSMRKSRSRMKKTNRRAHR